MRILRGEDYQAPGAGGVYPCAEGAGYAGGIMSAAVDGIRAALAVMAEYRVRLGPAGQWQPPPHSIEW